MSVTAPTRRQLIITGGWAHPFDRTAPYLADLMGGAAIGSEIADDLEAAAATLNAGSFDLVTVYACWFTMSDPRYDEVRDEWARATPTALREALGAHVDAGRGVLALHTAPICFDDWSAWPTIVGGGWNWDRSWHPQPAAIRIETDGHPIVAGLDSFDVVDERYTDLDVSPGAEIIAWSVADDRQPAIWTHAAGNARVVYDALGHDERSLGQANHAAVLRRCALWAAGAPDAEVSAIR
jgi:uncharacterized protein